MASSSSRTCTYKAHRDDPSNWHGEEPEDWMLEEDSWSCPHDRLDHEAVAEPEYCIFHMDPEDLPDDVNEAEEFVRVVNEESNSDDPIETQRKKEFVGATFGRFEIEESTRLSTADDFPIRFDHAYFQEGISAEEVLFQQEVSFESVEFSGGKVSFLGAEFSGGGVSFRMATLEKANFSGQHLEEVDFSGADLKEEVLC